MIRGPSPHDATVAPEATRARERTPSPHASPFRALAGARTPLDGAAASRHLAGAWQAVFGEPIPEPALHWLWAQWALETAHGRAMHGNNFAGIKARKGGAVLSTTEGFGNERVRVRARFRTYSTPEEGARDHVTFIAKKFPLAIDALRRGDGIGFVAELERGGFFTGDPKAYLRGVERWAAVHAGSARFELGHDAEALPLGALVDGVLASLRPRADER
jgi:hypothetical protein